MLNGFAASSEYHYAGARSREHFLPWRERVRPLVVGCAADSAVNGMKLQYVMSVVACLLDKVSDTALGPPPLHHPLPCIQAAASQHMQSYPLALHPLHCARSHQLHPLPPLSCLLKYGF
ncbi:unnamed protein product [Pleuronectes platessa]|uniref:Uncharacterized protein n=1 Tax=Pleuronectes platessa TaxID=8262 RepID=A0A9N7YY90_PLEPL|nr:unnamed protein product [Pleuronectes platessa]